MLGGVVVVGGIASLLINAPAEGEVPRISGSSIIEYVLDSFPGEEVCESKPVA
jgi:hypothetical protein